MCRSSKGFIYKHDEALDKRSICFCISRSTSHPTSMSLLSAFDLSKVFYEASQSGEPQYWTSNLSMDDGGTNMPDPAISLTTILRSHLMAILGIAALTVLSLRTRYIIVSEYLFWLFAFVLGCVVAVRAGC